MFGLLLCCPIPSSLSRLGGAVPVGGRAVRCGVCVCATATKDRSQGRPLGLYYYNDKKRKLKRSPAHSCVCVWRCSSSPSSAQVARPEPRRDPPARATRTCSRSSRGSTAASVSLQQRQLRLHRGPRAGWCPPRPVTSPTRLPSPRRARRGAPSNTSAYSQRACSEATMAWTSMAARQTPTAATAATRRSATPPRCCGTTARRGWSETISAAGSGWCASTSARPGPPIGAGEQV